jgi:hypothetical protein
LLPEVTWLVIEVPIKETKPAPKAAKSNMMTTKPTRTLPRSLLTVSVSGLCFDLCDRHETTAPTAIEVKQKKAAIADIHLDDTQFNQ